LLALVLTLLVAPPANASTDFRVAGTTGEDTSGPDTRSGFTTGPGDDDTIPQLQAGTTHLLDPTTGAELGRVHTTFDEDAGAGVFLAATERWVITDPAGAAALEDGYVFEFQGDESWWAFRSDVVAEHGSAAWAMPYWQLDLDYKKTLTGDDMASFNDDRLGTVHFLDRPAGNPYTAYDAVMLSTSFQVFGFDVHEEYWVFMDGWAMVGEQGPGDRAFVTPQPYQLTGLGFMTFATQSETIAVESWVHVQYLRRTFAQSPAR
jgi:hypothetical protein